MFAALPNLVYNGGPVVSHAQVVMVNWGSGVPASVQTLMPAFYTDITVSDYWGILEEYSTSNQPIRFGSFLQSTTIVPTYCATAGVSCTVTDAEVTSELSAQISAGHLPTPTLDGSGNVNTIYMVHFDPKVTINVNGANSCSSGGFCAYNTTFTYNTLKVGAGVIPDQGGACALGCGGATALQGETLNSMAIMANVVTDPQVGVNVLSWYDQNYGELGFICPSLSSATATASGNGNSYTVYPLWSQHAHACTSVGYLFRNGFE